MPSQPERLYLVQRMKRRRNVTEKVRAVHEPGSCHGQLQNLQNNRFFLTFATSTLLIEKAEAVAIRAAKIAIFILILVRLD